MHEFTLAQNIMNTVEKSVPEGLDELKAINIEVGEFAGVVSDSLRMGLEVLLREKNLADVHINIIGVPATAICQCRATYTLKDIYTPCPKCGILKRQFLTGTDILIRSIQLSE